MENMESRIARLEANFNLLKWLVPASAAFIAAFVAVFFGITKDNVKEKVEAQLQQSLNDHGLAQIDSAVNRVKNASDEALAEITSISAKAESALNNVLLDEKEIAEIKNKLNDLIRATHTSGAGYLIIGETQICWGSEQATAEQPKYKWKRQTELKFAREFKSPPTLTVGINPNTSGTRFAPYNTSVKVASATVAIGDVNSGNDYTDPVRIDYVAIGRPK